MPAVLLTPRDVAVRLGVCRDTVYRLAERGELRVIRVGASIRIAPGDLDIFLEKHARAPAHHGVS